MRKLALTLLAAAVGGAPAALAGEDPMAVPVPVAMWGLEFSHATVVYAAVVALAIFAVCFVWSRGLSKERPGRGQAFLEMLIREFDNLTSDGFGTKRRGRVYLPWIITLFIFIWCCNMAGLFPIPEFSIGGFPVPSPAEPTSNVNTTVALALLFVFMIGHGSAVRYNGLWGYLKDYASPGGLIGLVMLPLNIVGKIAEIVSISFRLFGNIFGGAVIISVVSGLVYYIGLPVFLYGFFGVFVGTVQAFVFTMLALTYIASGAAEPAEENAESAEAEGAPAAA